MRRKQGLLFDGERAADAKQRAMEQVERNADEEATAAIYNILLQMRGEFTTDDIWARVPADIRRSVEPRVMGPLILRAAKAGLIRKVHRMQNSVMVRCHGRPKQVWVVNG